MAMGGSCFDGLGARRRMRRSYHPVITSDHRSWIRERAAEAEALRLLWGAERFEDRQASQRQSLQATADGRLRRYLVTGTRP
jgi:hypothetical protein